MSLPIGCGHQFVPPRNHPRCAGTPLGEESGWSLCLRCDSPRFRWADQNELRMWGRLEWSEIVWPPAAAVVIQPEPRADALISLTQQLAYDERLAGQWRACLTPVLAASILPRIHEIEVTWRGQLLAAISSEAQRYARQLAWEEQQRDPGHLMTKSCRLLVRPAPGAALAVARRGATAESMERERREIHMAQVESLVEQGGNLSEENLRDLASAARGPAHLMSPRIAQVFATWLMRRGFQPVDEDSGLVLTRASKDLRLSIAAHSLSFRIYDRSDPAAAAEVFEDLEKAIQRYEVRLAQVAQSGPYR